MQSRYFGLDIHKETIYVTVLDLGDNQAHQYEISTDRAALERFLKQLQPSDRVAFESCRDCRYYYNRIRPLVQEVLVANPKKLRWIAESGEKDDRNDSFVIAFLSSVGALPTVWMPDEETYQDRKLLAAYSNLVKEMTRYKNRIQSLLTCYKMENKTESKKCAEELLKNLRLILSETDMEIVAGYLRCLECLEAEAAILLQRIELRAGRRPEVALLMTIPGVDVILALTLLAYIGPIERFESPGSLANYAGLTPGRHSTGGKKANGKITKRGPKPLRWAANLIAEQLRRREGSYRNLYRRVNRRAGHSAAVVACGRKVLEAVWCMLTREQTFHEESPNLTKRKLARRGARLAAASSKVVTTRKEARETVKMRIGLLAELAGAGLEAIPLPPRLLTSFGRRSFQISA